MNLDPLFKEKVYTLNPYVSFDHFVILFSAMGGMKMNGDAGGADSDAETSSKYATTSRSVKFKGSRSLHNGSVETPKSDKTQSEALHNQVNQLKIELDAANRTIKELRYREEQLLER